MDMETNPGSLDGLTISVRIGMDRAKPVEWIFGILEPLPLAIEEDPEDHSAAAPQDEDIESLNDEWRTIE
ncbi:hypothetical protein KM043_003195 [Ampulex compressa]|nr:hypothetical protein KM043_003195 [Ampulex compressa]